MCNIEQINTPKGRLYKTPLGNLYPSATTVVSILNEKFIREWRNRVGDEKANEISKWASEHGSRFHELMEKTLKEGIQTLSFGEEFSFVYPHFVKNVFPKITEVKFVEQRMFSDTLRVAGTADLVAKFNGKWSIIDWKTSTHDKSPQSVMSYWCQLASYAVMVEELYGIHIEQLVLVFNKGDMECEIMTSSEVPLWIKRFKKVRQRYFELYEKVDEPTETF